MKIITIANSKGGVGKSTVTLNLYARLTASGARCAILDTDQQGTVRNMSELRDTPLNLVASIDDARAAGFGMLLIDTPPYRTTDRKYIDAAHLVVIPCNASPLDASASVAMIRDAGSKGVVLLNRVPVGSTLGNDVRAALVNKGAKVLESVLSNRVAFTRSGLVASVDDLGDDKAGSELDALAVELLILLTT